MNAVIWDRRTLKVIRSFPEEIKDELGFLIYRLQIGENIGMPRSRAMPSIGIGCHELRVKDRSGAYRVFYYLRLDNRILVFHAFQKKMEKTPRKEIEVAKNNLKEMLHEKE